MKSLVPRLLVGVVLVVVLGAMASAQNAVTFWNSVAVNSAVRAKSTAGMTGIFLAYSNLAAFDALNAINPRFQAYGGIMPPASPDASESAAVATAIHAVLVHYFPAQAASVPTSTPPFVGLDERYATYLASLSDAPAAITEGVTVGQQAASALIALRDGDGIFGVNTYVFQTPATRGLSTDTSYPVPWSANTLDCQYEAVHDECF
jgi:hypothetical protein